MMAEASKPSETDEELRTCIPEPPVCVDAIAPASRGIRMDVPRPTSEPLTADEIAELKRYGI